MGLNSGVRRSTPFPITPRRRLPFATLLGGALALAVAMGIARFAYTPLLPAMLVAAHLDTDQAGFLASVNYAGYLLGALLLTVVATGSARSLLLAASLITAVATTALMAATTDLAAWIVIRFVSGLASAGVFVLASDSVLTVVRRHGRAWLTGWHYSGVGIGIVASGVLAEAVVGHGGWRVGWLALAAISAVVVYPSWHWLSPGLEDDTPTAPERRIQPPGLTVPLTLLLAAYTLAGGGYIVTGTFLVTIVDRTPGLTSLGAGVWIVVGLAIIPLTPLWGVVGTRIGFALALSLAYVMLGCGILLPALEGGAPAVFTAAVLFGGTFMALSTLAFTLARRIAPDGSTTVVALLTLGFSAGQMVAPVLAGILAARTGSFKPALIAAAVAVFFGSLLIAILTMVSRAARDARA